jgi:hypothetical protein
MRALFLTRYAELGPSSRYRAAPFLARAGIECTFRPLLPNRYLEWLYADGARWVPPVGVGLTVLQALGRRWRLLAGGADGFDVVYLE